MDEKRKQFSLGLPARLALSLDVFLDDGAATETRNNRLKIFANGYNIAFGNNPYPPQLRRPTRVSVSRGTLGEKS